MYTRILTWVVLLMSGTASIAHAQTRMGPITIDNPLACDEAFCIIDAITSALYTIGIPLAIIMILYGGVLMATSGGNESRITKGKKTITYAVVGLLFVILSASIQTFIVNLLSA